MKTLGLVWNDEFDTIQMPMDFLGQTKPQLTSKREMMSFLAIVFDPLGLACLATLVGKMLLQQAWKEAVRWDERLPGDLMRRVQCYRESYNNLSALAVPRFVPTETRDRIELHGFADASEKAYAPCIYVRVMQGGEVKTVKLLC